MHNLFVEPIPNSVSDHGPQAKVSRRTAETAAWKNIVLRELGHSCRIDYDRNGGPVVSIPSVHIGVSHSSRSVAVLISDHPCALDIELRDRNFKRVIDRYLTEQEKSMCLNELYYAVAWCAKETLYKLYREKGTRLLEDLSITSISPDTGKVWGLTPDGEKIEMNVKTTDSEVLVFTV